MVVVLALLATGATITIAYALSSFIVGIFVDGRDLAQQQSMLWLALAAAAVRAAVHFIQEWAGFRASQEVKSRLRARALDVIERRGQSDRQGTGQLSLLLGPSLESLDVYFSKYLPQLVFTALVTPLFVILVWMIDPTSAISLIFTLPLIPLFMILIGLVTRDVQQKQLAALERLNGHFYEILRGIQTLKIFGRDKRQAAVLEEVAMGHRSRTMKVLRVSFLSGFALELAASLSVALIAVSIGIRLIDGQLDLLTGLFVLLLAPEAYLPLRNVGAQFHAAAEGVTVSSRVLDLISAPTSPQLAAAQFEPGLSVLTGPSGSGKSTQLRAAMGSGSSWMPQHSGVLVGSVRENIAGFGEIDPVALTKSIQLAQLDDVDLDLLLGSNPQLSGGQIQRLALARTLYHALSNGSNLLLLDEPTSQQDSKRQESIARALRELADSGLQVVVATHQPSLISVADREVQIG